MEFESFQAVDMVYVALISYNICVGNVSEEIEEGCGIPKQK